MPIKSAFLVPSSPLPYFHRDTPPWGHFADALTEAGERIAALAPDVLIVYATTWQAVMDQLWQTRPEQQGIHVDHNWFELGELSYDFHIDVDLADACVQAATANGIKSKGVNYDGFPIDTGTIVAMHFLNPQGKIPVVLASNNLYHDPDTVAELGQIAVAEADKQGKSAVAISIGELSGSFFRGDIDIATDHIFREEEDSWNRRMLDFLANGDLESLNANLEQYNSEARAEYGFKHIQFVLNALGNNYVSAELMAYGPLYGKGGVVMQFKP
jgi:2-aminophenol/2-amino-5-chlorophenol 1,6-dioxygenase alpha subunit